MDAEQQLLAALSRAFGDRGFDTTSVRLHAEHANDLAKALDEAIPNCRFGGKPRGRFKDGSARRMLMRLALQHFDTDHAGWWYFKKIAMRCRHG